ncbi:hypothetical protein Q4Q57_04470 [Shewanella sp. SP2S2-6]|uniref:hypothetical protein n=1 Tax=Shewanella sp. SP2S2-6 TaxID=3063540 RepID=UPI0028923757|nr:hypothetical protein [Shewanella sp. SP2S2-6]MDT3294401.1 hypothetical protein [Shewanella sp. SP2S2-6]
MKLRISSPSFAFDLETEERIDDLDKLKSIDGYTYIDDEEDNCFGFWLIDENDDSIIKDSGISGGYLQFSFNDKLNRLEASVEYILNKELSQEQIDGLIEYTIGQCMDGIGSSFGQEKFEELGMLLSLIQDKEQTEVQLYT